MQDKTIYRCEYLGETFYVDYVVGHLGDMPITPQGLDHPVAGQLIDFLDFLEWLNNDAEMAYSYVKPWQSETKRG